MLMVPMFTLMAAGQKAIHAQKQTRRLAPTFDCFHFDAKHDERSNNSDVKQNEKGAASVDDSVTRFGEIPLLWQKNKSLLQLLMVYFVFGITYTILWQIFKAIGQIFIDIEQIIFKSGHTG